MFWLGVFVVLAAFYGWLVAKMFVVGGDDDRAIREYQRQKAEFERWFE